MHQGLFAFAMLAGCSLGHGALAIDAPPSHDGSIVDMMTDAAIDAPAVDTDGDGVLDHLDNCPAVANDQRNHDGDAHGDACDRCPHLSSTADPDGDGDGVGDDCDPRPVTAGDSIALWEGFYDASSIAGWTAIGGTWSVGNGVLTQSSNAQGDVVLRPPINVARAAVTSYARVISFGTPTTGMPFTYPHVSVAAGVANNQVYFCSVYNDQNAGGRLYATTQVGGSYAFPFVAWPGTFAPMSEMRITLSLLGTNNVCTVLQGTSTIATTQGTIGPPAGLVQVTTRTAAASFDYVFVVAMP
jgi:hypothetical protein